MNTRSAAFAAEASMGKKRARRQKPVGTVTPWHSRILNALQHRVVFQGIDPEMDPAAFKRLQKRRAKNRVAKASRKANRR